MLQLPKTFGSDLAAVQPPVATIARGHYYDTSPYQYINIPIHQVSSTVHWLHVFSPHETRIHYTYYPSSFFLKCFLRRIPHWLLRFHTGDSNFHSWFHPHDVLVKIEIISFGNLFFSIILPTRYFKTTDVAQRHDSCCLPRHPYWVCSTSWSYLCGYVKFNDMLTCWNSWYIDHLAANNVYSN